MARLLVPVLRVSHYDNFYDVAIVTVQVFGTGMPQTPQIYRSQPLGKALLLTYTNVTQTPSEAPCFNAPIVSHGIAHHTLPFCLQSLPKWYTAALTSLDDAPERFLTRTRALSHTQYCVSTGNSRSLLVHNATAVQPAEH